MGGDPPTREVGLSERIGGATLPGPGDGGSPNGDARAGPPLVLEEGFDRSTNSPLSEGLSAARPNVSRGAPGTAGGINSPGEGLSAARPKASVGAAGGSVATMSRHRREAAAILRTCRGGMVLAGESPPFLCGYVGGDNV